MAHDNRSKEKFYWDNPSKALHLQTSIPLRITVGRKVFETESWSLSGFRLKDFHSNRADIVGKSFPASLLVHFRSFDIALDCTAKVTKYFLDTKILEAEFVELKEEHQEVLRYFISSVASGEMISIDKVLRRVDRPVDSPTIQLPAAEKSVTKSLVRFAMTGLYSLLGLLLLGYLLLSLYSSHFRLEIESAVTSNKIVTVQSNMTGTVAELKVAPKSLVQVGTPLVRIKTDSHEQDKAVASASHDLRAAEIKITKLQELLNNQDQKLVAYQKVAVANQQQARIKRDSAQRQLNLSQSAVQRMNDLFQQGVISRIAAEEKQVELLASQEALRLANFELGKAQQALGNVKSGYFYTGNKLEGDRPELEAELRQARREYQLAKDTLESVAQKPVDQVIRSPFKGEVKEWLVNDFQYLQAGQDIATVIDASEDQRIDAYLTQEEVNWVGMDTKAVAYVPAIDQKFPVYVSGIDRTDGFFEEIKNRFSWRVTDDKTAKVELSFSTPPGEALSSGLPVIVNISRRNDMLDWLPVPVQDFIRRFISLDDPDEFGSASLALTDKASADENGAVTQTPESGEIKVVSESAGLEAGDSVICQGVLWPESVVSYLKNKKQQSQMPEPLLKSLLKKADEALEVKPQALQQLVSAGVVDPKDPRLVQTRVALRDSERSALLALAYQLTGKAVYRLKAEHIILNWAKTHKPDGHPINESRLDYMLWAYDLLRCEMSDIDKSVVHEWLARLSLQKKNWKFGPSSSRNNHKTHQLKIELMLARLLGDAPALRKDLRRIDEHLATNILEGGVTFDYNERNALHYHVYDLEAWLEIALLAPETVAPVDEAAQFLLTQLREGNIHDQFVNSQQKIDAKRSESGFEYAKKGGDYKPEKASRALLAYATLKKQPLPEVVPERYNELFTEEHFQKSLFAYLRYHLWVNASGG